MKVNESEANEIETLGLVPWYFCLPISSLSILAAFIVILKC